MIAKRRKSGAPKRGANAVAVDELAEMTGVSAATIYASLEEDSQVLGVQALKIRNRWVIPRRPIEEALQIHGETIEGKAS